MKTVKVRNIEIGAGVPKVIVPIVAKDAEGIVAKGKELTAYTMDVVEWRVDFYEDVFDIAKTVETAGKLREALGDKKGIRRYAHIVLPLAEALTLCAVDISGRGYLNYDAKIYTEKIGDFDSELIKEFFEAFVRKSEVTLHFVQFAGENSHHIAESMFKAFGRTMAKACSIDPERAQELPSTKGVL